MKRLKEYLNEIDIDLVSEYFYENYYLNCVKDEKNKQNKTLFEIRQKSDKYINKLIKRLEKLEPIKLSHKKTGVLFGYSNHKREPYFVLVYIGDLIDKRLDADTYAYDTIKHEELLSYYVAETEFTKNNISELFAYLCWEITWYGIKQEKLDTFLKNLYKSIDSARKDEDLYKKKKRNKISDFYKGKHKLIEPNDFIYSIEKELDDYKMKKEIAEVMFLLQQDNL